MCARLAQGIVPAMVFLDVPVLSLAMGIRLVDSMLYSTGGVPIVIVLTAMIWSIPGAIVGGVLGCLCSVDSQTIRR